MANLFEKPIAANPMSEFSALPLQFIDQALQRKQAMYDKAKAETAGMEDDLYGSKALGGDMQRNIEIRKGYEDQINSMVDNADGDYSSIAGELDILKRKIKRDLSYGELAAQKMAYTSAMGKMKEYDKLYQTGKIQKSGLDMFKASIGKHITTPLENGGFNRFSGYTPSNIVDTSQKISDAVDEISAKYDADGQAYRDEATIRSIIDKKIQSVPGIMQSIQENFQSVYNGKPEDAGENFKLYYNNIIKKTIQEKEYKKYNNLAQGGARSGTSLGFEFKNFQTPNVSGSFDYKGASLARPKSWVKDILNFNTTEEFTNSISTPESKRRIKYIERKTGEKFPQSYLAQVDWIERNVGKQSVQSLVTRNATGAELAHYMTKDGMLKNPTTGLYGKDGKPLSGDKMEEFQGKDKSGKVARVLGIVESGKTYPIGSVIMQGKDGTIAVQLPSDVDTLTSPQFKLWQINNVKNTNTGATTIKLDTPFKSSSGEQIPIGYYQAEHNLIEGKEGNTDGGVTLYQNGIPMYIILPNNELKIL